MDAQITIERSDYTAQVGSTIIRQSVSVDLMSLPTTGTNQIWDYTDITLVDLDTITLNAYDGTEYPDANISRDEKNLTMVGNTFPVVFDRTVYEVLNDTEHGRIGVKNHALDFPVGPFTGFDSDTFNFFENSRIYPDDPEYYAWFPMNYDDSRESSFIFDNEFLQTVTPFALDQVPSTIRTYGNSLNEVVGWGNLSLTNPTDQSTVTLEALLMTTFLVEADSFFILGAPTNPALLMGLGLTQGQLQTFQSYSFYAKGFPGPVLTFDQDGNGWLLADLEAITASQEVDANAISFSYYPNPATEQINLEFEKSTNEPWVFSLYNSLGQKMYDHKIDQPTGKVNEYIDFGKQMQAGHYSYVLYNGDRKIMSSGGLQIN